MIAEIFIEKVQFFILATAFSIHTLTNCILYFLLALNIISHFCNYFLFLIFSFGRESEGDWWEREKMMA
jgi:hypothetical protein